MANESPHSSSISQDAALNELVAALRDEDSVISPHVRDSDESPALGLLAAAGSRCAKAPGEYALVVESVREGYLLHFERGRIVKSADPDLSLLAGDYLYARGLERLAALGDLEAVRELADLISLCAQAHAERGGDAAAPLWLASVAAIAAGGTPEHEEAKGALRDGADDAAERLWRSAQAIGARDGLLDPLERAAQSVGFTPRPDPDLG